jgi:hypothetical protein
MNSHAWDGAANGRSESGRFVRGNRESVGHRPNRRAAELKAMLMAAASPDDLRAILLKLAEMAKGGDVQAARVYLDHVVGRPVQAVQVEMEVDELPPVNVAAILHLIGDAMTAEFGGTEDARIRVAAVFRRLAAIDGWPDGIRSGKVIILPDNGTGRRRPDSPG